MRWAAFQTPRGRQVGWAIAVGLLTLTVTIWVVALVSAIDWFARSFAIDYGIYMGALDRWQAGNCDGRGRRDAVDAKRPLRQADPVEQDLVDDDGKPERCDREVMPA